MRRFAHRWVPVRKPTRGRRSPPGSSLAVLWAQVQGHQQAAARDGPVRTASRRRSGVRTGVQHHGRFGGPASHSRRMPLQLSCRRWCAPTSIAVVVQRRDLMAETLWRKFRELSLADPMLLGHACRVALNTLTTGNDQVLLFELVRCGGRTLADCRAGTGPRLHHALCALRSSSLGIVGGEVPPACLSCGGVERRRCLAAVSPPAWSLT